MVGTGFFHHSFFSKNRGNDSTRLSNPAGAQMCVHAYGRRVSVVDVRVFRAYARGERLLWVINISIRSSKDARIFTGRNLGLDRSRVFSG